MPYDALITLHPEIHVRWFAFVKVLLKYILPVEPNAKIYFKKIKKLN